MFKLGAFAIIKDEKKRVLLCHRLDYDLWNLPGGGVEEKESPWQAVIREVKEETELDVEVERISGVYSKPEKNEVVFAFICKVVGGEARTTNEADRIEYFEFERIPKNTAPRQVERIKYALAEYGKTPFRIQRGESSIDLVKKGRL